MYSEGVRLVRESRRTLEALYLKCMAMVDLAEKRGWTWDEKSAATTTINGAHEAVAGRAILPLSLSLFFFFFLLLLLLLSLSLSPPAKEEARQRALDPCLT